MPFGIDDALMLGTGIFGAISGHKQQKKADQLQQRALDQSQQQYDARAPFRNLGMQQLGHAEQAYDMGHLGYNDQNPFAKARGPAPSNATITGTANNTFQAPIEQPTAAPNADPQRALFGAIASNGQLPPAVRHAAQQRLGALPPVQAPTTYGFGGR